jgi:hypothetical protein
MNCLSLLTHCYRAGNRIELHYRNSNTNRDLRSDVQNAMNVSLYERSPVRCVIKPSVMQKLLQSATVLHEGTQERCPIMQSELDKGDVVLALPCGHVFLKDAIQTWLETESAECPVCRHALPSCEIMNQK